MPRPRIARPQGWFRFTAPTFPGSAFDKEYWVKKEVERPKFMAKHVVKAVQDAGFKKFLVSPEHLRMWQSQDAKADGKGFGVLVEGTWYWYQSWIDRCVELCHGAGDTYKSP